MKVKIFDFGLCKAMIMGDEKGTSLYMQIKHSDWFFCLGDYEPFDEWDDEETINALCKDYFASVKEQEDVLTKYLDEKMEQLIRGK